ncbi:hypothetical protein TNCV_3810891 [Trichonephila clavipes]|nr:hypothetical protein TNCV_3810891 [Trichonephila clavipes]
MKVRMLVKKNQYLNACANKFQTFPSTSTSTFSPSEKSTYVLMNDDDDDDDDDEMGSSLLGNIKCDECDMCSLDVEYNGAFGFSTKVELKYKSCKKYLTVHSLALEMMIANISRQIKRWLKLF